MLACTQAADNAGLAFRIYDLVGCRARALGENGLQALAGGSLFGQLLSGLLVIAVALFGYRLLLGERLVTRTAVHGAARLGVVLALTGNWAAFDTVFERVVFDGPFEIAGIILPAAGLDEPTTLIAKVQAAHDGIVAAGRIRTPEDGSAPQTRDAASQAARPEVPPVDGVSLRPLAFAAAAALFVVTALGSLLAAQLAAGLLLALAPFFIATLLFEAARGIFAGWLRALALSVLGTLLTMAGLSIELELLAGELARGRSIDAPVDPAGLFIVTALFVMMLPLLWWICARAIGRIRLAPSPMPAAPAPPPATLQPPATMPPGAASASGPAAPSPRVQAMAAAIVRHEGGDAARTVIGDSAGAAPAVAPAGVAGSSVAPLSPAATASPGPGTRRTEWRRMASTARRDSQA